MGVNLDLGKTVLIILVFHGRETKYSLELQRCRYSGNRQRSRAFPVIPDPKEIKNHVNGSPLADRFSEASYDNWFVKLSFGKCRPGDGGVLDSLSRTRQFQWLATRPLPDHVRYFSLAAFARYEDVQLHQRFTYKLLEPIEPLNDGQLIFLDQLIPGSALLGYVNADHWTVAVPVEEKFSDRDPAQKAENRKLRQLLFEAMILFLAESLNVSP